MIRPARPRLLDIDENVTVALDLGHRRILKHLIHDRTMRYAMQHAILIIAEAVHHLPNELRDRYGGAAASHNSKQHDQKISTVFNSACCVFR